MSQLSIIIEKQHRLLQELKVTISEEKSALVNQDAELLLSLASSKAKLLDALKANDDNLSSQPDIASLSSDPHLIELVDITKTKLAECQQLNIENTSLIELNIASVNRFAQALQVSRNASSLTYNDKGKTSTISSLGNNLKA
ncbi:flagellar protein FlgN [Shewanella sp. D64]|uniref:flagella synthesis protein FlgN n=1 Tax=unclassified Shewanella TaxID=196818 RepID=UPI0022BA5190|nr:MULTISPECIES: flagellar protein FlgN [unclassified Shewanella]MEC4726537.1 flagellar protein FlgN [Shewanella sp. D64]MEC4737422.1 flagellar protein FlgN [Shewanella sp. E94]WBJ97241.1 flagellar protein FlgN [Shewanella sp. MTB7]